MFDEPALTTIIIVFLAGAILWMLDLAQRR